MADPTGTTGPDPSQAKPRSSGPAFLASRNGKVIAAVVGVVVVLAAVGAILFLFVFSGGEKEQTPLRPTGGGKSTASTQTVAPVNPPEPPLDDTFTFRNIFRPSVSPPKPPEEDSDGTGTEDGESTEDTLVLESIASDSGERVATFTWNGQEYQVKEGEVVDSSPWKVITIYSDSALMLYGDTKITLTVGQGFGGDTSSSGK